MVETLPAPFDSAGVIGFVNAFVVVSVPVAFVLIPEGIIVDAVPGTIDGFAAETTVTAKVAAGAAILLTTGFGPDSSDLRFRFVPGTDGLRGCLPPDAGLAGLESPVSSFFVSAPALGVVTFFLGPSTLPVFVLRDPFPPAITAVAAEADARVADVGGLGGGIPNNVSSSSTFVFPLFFAKCKCFVASIPSFCNTSFCKINSVNMSFRNVSYTSQTRFVGIGF